MHVKGLRAPLGLHDMLLRQAHHVQHATVEGGWLVEQLQAAFSSLSSVRELTLLGFEYDEEIVCLCALSGRPSSLSSVGDCLFDASAALQQLQRLRLSLSAVHESNLQHLAGWLPPLQQLQLQVALPRTVTPPHVNNLE